MEKNKEVWWPVIIILILIIWWLCSCTVTKPPIPTPTVYKAVKIISEDNDGTQTVQYTSALTAQLSVSIQNYVAHWTLTGAKIDSLFQGIDSNKLSFYQSVFGGIDSSVVPNPGYYTQVKSGANKSNIVYVPANALPVNLSNISVSGRTLYFTSNNENNLKNYLIFESVDGINWILISTILPKGNSNYIIYLQ